MHPSELLILATAPFVLGIILISAIWRLTARYLDAANNPPYFTWYVLHLAIGLVGLLVILVLALQHDLNAAATAVVASIVSYGLGASTSQQSKSSPMGLDAASRLAKIQELHGNGALTDEEYHERRQAVIEGL